MNWEKTLQSSRSEQSIMGSNTFTHILSYTSAACDARMAGAMIPVMSNSGSGNQGIAATLPVRSFCGRESQDGRRTDSCLGTQSSDSYLHQAESGTSVGFVWLCRGGYRKQLRNYLPDGRGV